MSRGPAWRRRLGAAAVGRSLANVERALTTGERSAATWAWYAVALRRLAIAAVVTLMMLMAWRFGSGIDGRTARSLDTLGGIAGLTAILCAGGSGIARRWRDGTAARLERLRRTRADLQEELASLERT